MFKPYLLLSLLAAISFANLAAANFCSLLVQEGNYLPPEKAPLIAGVGVALGSETITVAEIAERLQLDPKGISRRTGTHSLYRMKNDESMETLAVRAAQAALAQAHLKAEDITAIYTSTASPTGDFHMPGLARQLGDRLGVGNINMTSISLGCCGGMDALLAARQHVALATFQNRSASVLVVAADHTSRSLNPDDRASAFLFSEGAGAMVVTNNPRLPGYLMERANATCTPGNIFCMNIPNPKVSNADGFSMDGEAVLTFVVNEVAPRLAPLLGWEELPQDALVIPHQGSRTILNQLELRIDRPVFKETIGRVGNTTGSSFIFAFHDALGSESARSKELILLAFGAELKIGAVKLTPRGGGLSHD